jgi:amino acid transporter
VKTQAHPAPQTLLRRRDAVAIIVGIVIGAGIFKTPSMVAGLAGDAGWMLAAWIAGALVSLIGALCYAELASAFPSPGGDYHFLTRAYGRDLSFLYAWARATVINTGSIALLAFVFGDYFSQLAPLGAKSGAIWAAAIVIVLTIVNIVGLRASAHTQNVLTVLQITGIAAIVLAGLVAPASTPSPAAFSARPEASALGLAMVFVLLTYGGWNEAAYISAEVRGGRRAIVSALVVGLLIIAAVYIAMNASLAYGLGQQGLAQSKVAAADAMTRAFGPWAGRAVGVVVSLAVLTSINPTMITGARTSYAMGRDWPALRFLGGWNVARGVPVTAYLVQAALALALIVFGAFQHDGFEAMVEFTAPVFWAFFFLVGLAVFVLRGREPEAERPFRVPLYPITPILFCAVCAYLFHSSVSYAASRNAVHVAFILMALGLVALALTRLGRRAPA